MHSYRTFSFLKLNLAFSLTHLAFKRLQYAKTINGPVASKNATSGSEAIFSKEKTRVVSKTKLPKASNLSCVFVSHFTKEHADQRLGRNLHCERNHKRGIQRIFRTHIRLWERLCLALNSQRAVSVLTLEELDSTYLAR